MGLVSEWRLDRTSTSFVDVRSTLYCIKLHVNMSVAEAPASTTQDKTPEPNGHPASQADDKGRASHAQWWFGQT